MHDPRDDRHNSEHPLEELVERQLAHLLLRDGLLRELEELVQGGLPLPVDVVKWNGDTL